MKYRYLHDASIKVPEFFYQNCNADILPDIETSVVVKGDGELYDHSRMMDRIRTAMINHHDDPENLDGDIAVILHSDMGLSRREAAFASLWHYYALFECLDYVKWRWHQEGMINKERVVGAWRRNALGRLWWWAEITHDEELDDPYLYTKRGARSQEFMLHAVDDFIGGDKGLMLAMCKKFFPEIYSKPDRNFIRAAFAKLNAALDTIAADALTDEDKILLVEEVIRDAASQVDEG